MLTEEELGGSPLVRRQRRSGGTMVHVGVMTGIGASALGATRAAMTKWIHQADAASHGQGMLASPARRTVNVKSVK